MTPLQELIIRIDNNNFFKEDVKITLTKMIEGLIEKEKAEIQSYKDRIQVLEYSLKSSIPYLERFALPSITENAKTLLKK